MKNFISNAFVHTVASWITIIFFLTKAIKYLNKIFPIGAFIAISWYDIFLLCLLSTAVIFSIHAYYRSGKNEKKFESIAEGFKSFEKGISDTIDLVVKNQEEFNKRFEWLYQQIEKNQKPNP